MSSGLPRDQLEARAAARGPRADQSQVLAAATRPQTQASNTAAARREKLKQLEQSLFGYSGAEVGRTIE